MALALFRYALAAILLIANAGSPAFAQTVQPVPALTAHVVDHSATLSQAEISALDARLAAFEQQRGTQIVVLLVPTTAPEDIAAYANRVANEWKIGRKGVGDGLLLVIAKQDRKLRIEVAKTLEGAVPDLAARRIIDEAIAPQFKRERYADGISAGLDRLFALIQGEALPAPEASGKTFSSNVSDFDWVDLGVFLFFAVPLGARMTQALMGRIAGTLTVGLGTGLLAFLITSSLGVAIAAALLAMIWGLLSAHPKGHGGSGSHWGSGPSSLPSSGGGSGSDGFSSGGGGDFGGGGASGDW